MKRSEIEAAIVYAKNQLEKQNIALPMFGYWQLDDWRDNRNLVGTIISTMRGWDVTDFGSGDFSREGAVLFTVRNGLLGHPEVGCPYAEKLIIMREGQQLPMHYHFKKTEDIINRGGGLLQIQVYRSLPDQSIDYDSNVDITMDGIDYKVKAGTVVDITTGNSLTIRPGMYHLFKAKGDMVIAGEVSSLNDDHTDNRFLKPQGRFSDIEEDVLLTVPLCNEYEKLLKSPETLR